MDGSALKILAALAEDLGTSQLSVAPVPRNPKPSSGLLVSIRTRHPYIK